MCEDGAVRKTGIFGGSFDPVHTGHVNVALRAREEAGLDRVVFMPAHIQPFKLDARTAPAEDRLAMLRLAAEDAEGLEVSDYEILNTDVSYTINTMRAMREVYAGSRLYFILGTDSFLKVETWRCAEELLSDYAFIVGARPGYLTDELEETSERIRERFGTEIIMLDNSLVDASSTEIRDRIELGSPLTGLVPYAVEKYIYEKGLYR